LVDCARVLLVWAAVRRAGAPDDTVAALALAYRFGLAAGDVAVLGLFFHLAAQLLADLGQPGLALRFAQTAGRHFQSLRDRSLLPKALLVCSRAHLQLGQRREARMHAVAALRLAGRDQWRVRSFAWIQLAGLAQARGNVRRAFGLLERAKKNSRTEELKALIHGRQAVLLVQLGRNKKASRAFGQAMRYFSRSGQYREIAFFAADLAEALIFRGRVAETLELVRTVMPCFERVEPKARAAGLWLDLCALLHSGRRNRLREQILLVREALAGEDRSLFQREAGNPLPFFPFFLP
jgi:tetratricopeptide (TPR) repeat protein